MNRYDLDGMCDPSSDDRTKDKLAAIMRLLSGLRADEARSLLRYAGNAIDSLAVIPSVSDMAEPLGEEAFLNMTDAAFVAALQKRSAAVNEINALRDRVSMLEKRLMYGGAALSSLQKGLENYAGPGSGVTKPT